MFDAGVLEKNLDLTSPGDVGDLADETLFDGVTAIARVRARLDAVETAMLAELDARGATDVAHGLRTSTWLSRETGVSRSTAGQRLNVGRQLRRNLPATAEALAGGLVSFDHARVLADAINDRIAEQFADMEPEFVELAAEMTFDRWRQRVRLVAALLDQDGGYNPHDDITNNRLRATYTPDGLIINGCLVGDASMVTLKALEQVADELFHRFARDAEHTNGDTTIPGRATLLALAFHEICRRALAVDLATTQGPKIEATLVINAAEPEHVFDQHGNPLIGQLFGSLCCHMSLYPIVINNLGVPLDMGREIRTPNRAQRRALALRDGGCVFPGCDQPPEHTDNHHVDHWARDLGTTNVHAMVLLCRHHHGVVHRTGWNIHIGNEGWAWITTPTGQQLWCQQHGHTRTDPIPNTPPQRPTPDRGRPLQSQLA